LSQAKRFFLVGKNPKSSRMSQDPGKEYLTSKKGRKRYSGVIPGYEEANKKKQRRRKRDKDFSVAPRHSKGRRELKEKMADTYCKSQGLEKRIKAGGRGGGGGKHSKGMFFGENNPPRTR